MSSPEAPGDQSSKLPKELTSELEAIAAEQPEPKSAQLLERMPPEIRAHAERMEENFQNSKPYLFALADQLITAYGERKWTELVGDETGGRLPARFVRKTLLGAGIDLPIDYIEASGVSRKEKPESLYDQRAAGITAQGHDKVLVISEQANTFRGSRYLRDRLSPHAKTVDFAFVTARSEPPADLGASFVGGIGEVAKQSSYHAYENPGINTGPKEKLTLRIARKILPEKVKMAIKMRQGPDRTSSAALTNLEKNPNPQSPVARATEDKTYGLLAAYSYTRMDELADEYHAQFESELAA
jgi:hypothetical protein